jgi:zinc protease
MSALGDHLPQTIGLLAEALRHPHFDPGDVARIRRERVAELELHLDQPRIVAAQLFDRIEFGDQHPYGHPAEGDWRAVDALEQPDVRAFWSRAYGPTTTKLIVAGGVSREVLEHELDRAFGDWTNPPPPAVPRAPPAAAPQLAYVDRPGADEVAIVIGRRVDPPTGPAADRAQRLAGDLENAVMGGAAARFPLRFAELGYGGAIGSSFWRGELGGTWSVAATVKRREAAAATREMLRMIATARTVDASAAELAHARTQLVRGTPLGFETNWGVAHALQRLVVGGLPMDHYATYADGLADITPAVARGAAAAWTDLTVVVVGDWAQIAHDFDRLGLPVVRYDVR